MLTAIRVGNFKAFAETQRIPVCPLTLIYGANSSGKSSILHSLILARHALETGEIDVNLTKVGGTAVDLGGFKQYVHQRNTASLVHFDWEISNHGFSKKLREDLLPGINKATFGLSVGLSADDASLIKDFGDVTPRQVMQALIEDAKKKGDEIEVDRLESKLAESEAQLTLEEILALNKEVRVENCWLDLDDRRFLSLSARTGGILRLDMLDRQHEAARYLIKNLILAYSTTDHVDSGEIDSLSGAIDELIPSISFKIQNLFPQELIGEDSGSSTRGIFVTVRKESRVEDLKTVIRQHLPGMVEEILVGIGEAIGQELGKLTYLGPLRTYPPRHVAFSEVTDQNWVAGGGAAWDLVKKDSSIRQKVNEWLGDEKKLSTHYEIKKRYLLTIDNIRAKFFELTSRATSKFREKRFDEEGEDLFWKVEEEIDEIPDSLEKLEPLFSDIHEIVLFDKRSKTAVSHRDVGIGISQVLPVLVTCFASTDKIIAMEQPEIHLHPALQAELGDVFIEAALGERKNTLIIETHSEHLLLRIMRRMRETSSQKLPGGNPPVYPQDVMVLFVEPEGSRSIVREMSLNDQGELIKAWPGGFFEEGFKEVFSD
jgi:predicted ATPase